MEDGPLLSLSGLVERIDGLFYSDGMDSTTELHAMRGSLEAARKHAREDHDFSDRTADRSSLFHYATPLVAGSHDLQEALFSNVVLLLDRQTERMARTAALQLLMELVAIEPAQDAEDSGGRGRGGRGGGGGGDDDAVSVMALNALQEICRGVVGIQGVLETCIEHYFLDILIHMAPTHLFRVIPWLLDVLSGAPLSSPARRALGHHRLAVKVKGEIDQLLALLVMHGPTESLGGVRHLSLLLRFVEACCQTPLFYNEEFCESGTCKYRARPFRVAASPEAQKVSCPDPNCQHEQDAPASLPSPTAADAYSDAALPHYIIKNQAQIRKFTDLLRDREEQEAGNKSGGAMMGGGSDSAHSRAFSVFRLLGTLARGSHAAAAKLADKTDSHGNKKKKQSRREKGTAPLVEDLITLFVDKMAVDAEDLAQERSSNQRGAQGRLARRAWDYSNQIHALVGLCWHHSSGAADKLEHKLNSKHKHGSDSLKAFSAKLWDTALNFDVQESDIMDAAIEGLQLLTLPHMTKFAIFDEPSVLAKKLLQLVRPLRGKSRAFRDALVKSLGLIEFYHAHDPKVSDSLAQPRGVEGHGTGTLLFGLVLDSDGAGVDDLVKVAAARALGAVSPRHLNIKWAPEMIRTLAGMPEMVPEAVYAKMTALLYVMHKFVKASDEDSQSDAEGSGPQFRRIYGKEAVEMVYTALTRSASKDHQVVAGHPERSRFELACVKFLQEAWQNPALEGAGEDGMQHHLAGAEAMAKGEAAAAKANGITNGHSDALVLDRNDSYEARVHNRARDNARREIQALACLSACTIAEQAVLAGLRRAFADLRAVKRCVVCHRRTERFVEQFPMAPWLPSAYRCLECLGTPPLEGVSLHRGVEQTLGGAKVPFLLDVMESMSAIDTVVFRVFHQLANSLQEDKPTHHKRLRAEAEKGFDAWNEASAMLPVPECESKERALWRDGDGGSIDDRDEEEGVLDSNSQFQVTRALIDFARTIEEIQREYSVRMNRKPPLSDNPNDTKDRQKAWKSFIDNIEQNPDEGCCLVLQNVSDKVPVAIAYWHLPHDSRIVSEADHIERKCAEVSLFTRHYVPKASMFMLLRALVAQLKQAKVVRCFSWITQSEQDYFSGWKEVTTRKNHHRPFLYSSTLQDDWNLQVDDQAPEHAQFLQRNGFRAVLSVFARRMPEAAALRCDVRAVMEQLGAKLNDQLEERRLGGRRNEADEDTRPFGEDLRENADGWYELPDRAAGDYTDNVRRSMQGALPLSSVPLHETYTVGGPLGAYIMNVTRLGAMQESELSNLDPHEDESLAYYRQAEESKENAQDDNASGGGDQQQDASEDSKQKPHKKKNGNKKNEASLAESMRAASVAQRETDRLHAMAKAWRARRCSPEGLHTNDPTRITGSQVHTCCLALLRTFRAMLRSDKKTVKESRRRLSNGTVLARLHQILLSVDYGIRKDVFAPAERHHDAGLSIKALDVLELLVTEQIVGRERCLKQLETLQRCSAILSEIYWRIVRLLQSRDTSPLRDAREARARREAEDQGEDIVQERVQQLRQLLPTEELAMARLMGLTATFVRRAARIMIFATKGRWTDKANRECRAQAVRHLFTSESESLHHFLHLFTAYDLEMAWLNKPSSRLAPELTGLNDSKMHPLDQLRVHLPDVQATLFRADVEYKAHVVSSHLDGRIKHDMSPRFAQLMVALRTEESLRFEAELDRVCHSRLRVLDPDEFIVDHVLATRHSSKRSAFSQSSEVRLLVVTNKRLFVSTSLGEEAGHDAANLNEVERFGQALKKRAFGSVHRLRCSGTGQLFHIEFHLPGENVVLDTYECRRVGQARRFLRSLAQQCRGFTNRPKPVEYDWAQLERVKEKRLNAGKTDLVMWTLCEVMTPRRQLPWPPAALREAPIAKNARLCALVVGNGTCTVHTLKLAPGFWFTEAYLKECQKDKRIELDDTTACLFQDEEEAHMSVVTTGAVERELLHLRFPGDVSREQWRRVLRGVRNVEVMSEPSAQWPNRGLYGGIPGHALETAGKVWSDGVEWLEE